MNGEKLVHDYFNGDMGWSPEKSDPDQYLNVNFRAKWVGAAIDAHVAAKTRELAVKVVDLEDKVARLEMELAAFSAVRPVVKALKGDADRKDEVFHVEPPK